MLGVDLGPRHPRRVVVKGREWRGRGSRRGGGGKEEENEGKDDDVGENGRWDMQPLGIFSLINFRVIEQRQQDSSMSHKRV